MQTQSIPHHNISGVMPHLAVKAGHLPARTETGIGGLMPWANRLWFVTYVAHKQGTGSGTGLFSIDDGMNLGRQAAARATHATGSAVFFWALAVCWCTRIDELPIIWISPAQAWETASNRCFGVCCILLERLRSWRYGRSF